MAASLTHKDMLNQITQNKDVEYKRFEIKGKRKTDMYFGDVYFSVDKFENNDKFTWDEHYSGGCWKSSTLLTGDQVLDKLLSGKCYNIEFVGKEEK